jgi:uncharacterized membrane protein
MDDLLLTVLVFDTPEQGVPAAATANDLAATGAIAPLASAVATWGATSRAPLVEPTAPALVHDVSESFWHTLFHSVFYAPLLDAATGQPSPATSWASEAVGLVGIDHVFINQLRDTMHPGTSALLALSTSPEADAVYDRLTAGEVDRPTVLAKRLPRRSAGALRHVFVQEDLPASG